MSAQGVTIGKEHFPELLKAGIDTFLERRGVQRLILHCLREENEQVTF